ncbi:MAG: NADH-quinone oxidoreductase subunit C [Nitrososphaerales archaeon]|nr:NADH-quinone oxidoreductase subunit C [Nitrososphaerales archaeon]
MNENNVSEALKNKFGEKISKIMIPKKGGEEAKDVIIPEIMEIKVSKRRVFVTVPVEVYKEVIRYLVEDLGFNHVQAITGLDTGKFIEVMPHLGRGITVTVRTRIERDKPMLSTITDIVPGASPHERELHDLLGVVFEGHPNLTRITLPEGWPENVYPLRKEYTPEQPKPLREVS